MPRQTNPVRVYERDHDRLHDRKQRGDTYPDVVERLLDRVEELEAQLPDQKRGTKEAEA
jgi:hypothetical protein